MYELGNAPTDSILREIQFRLDAMRGCVLPAYDVEELVRELRDRVGEPPGQQGRITRDRVARLYGRVLAAKYRIRGLAQVDRSTLVALATADRQDAPAHADETRDSVPGDEGDLLDDTAAKARAEADLREAVTAIYRVHGIRGARAFLDWFDRHSVDLEAVLPAGCPVALLEIEHDAGDPAPERAWLWYRDRDDLERSVRVGTVRRWLKAAHDASAGASDEGGHPKRVCYKGGTADETETTIARCRGLAPCYRSR